MTTLEFTVLDGTFWGASGDLFYALNESGQVQARVYVDSLGETWVDIRAIPEGGYFHTERVTGFRLEEPLDRLRAMLAALGYAKQETARYAHRVQQRYA